MFSWRSSLSLTWYHFLFFDLKSLYFNCVLSVTLFWFKIVSSTVLLSMLTAQFCAVLFLFQCTKFVFFFIFKLILNYVTGIWVLGLINNVSVSRSSKQCLHGCIGTQYYSTLLITGSIIFRVFCLVVLNCMSCL